MGYKKNNIMILGAGGSLGSELCKVLKAEDRNVIGVDRCENRLSYLNRLYDISTFLIDIEDSNRIIDLINNYSIDTVINTAAMKHIISCETMIEKAIAVNIMSNLHLVEYLKKAEKSFIFISSDKAIHPTNMYALTKQFTDYIVKKNGFSVVRGVNFLNSKGSVIDIWKRQMIEETPFTLIGEECERYFITINQMAMVVRNAIDDESGNQEFCPPEIYRIKIHNLFHAFLKYYNIINPEIKNITLNKYEKLMEDINFNPEVIVLDDIKDIMALFDISIKKDTL